MLDRPHHDGSSRYVATSTPKLGDVVDVAVRVPDPGPVAAVVLRTVHDGEPVFAPLRPDPPVGGEQWYRGAVTVRNPVTPYRFLLVQTDGHSRWLTQAGVHDHDVPDAGDFRLTTAPAPPDWVQDTVLYQIVPDRFARSGQNLPRPDWAASAAWDDPIATGHPDGSCQFYGGDLLGIADHVDHLADLGVTAVYLTPFFPARSNHRYDATTFDHVDPALGGDAGLATLAATLHDRGIRLLGDLTLNHTGSEHTWFRRAIADPASPEHGFYHWLEHPDRYESWGGFRTLPKLDHRDAELRRRLYAAHDSVAARYLRPPFELDGWRVDAANVVGRCGDIDVNAIVARTLRATIAKAHPGAFLLAEHAHDAAPDLTGDGWHGTTAYAAATRPLWGWLRPAATAVDYLRLPLPPPRADGPQAAAAMTAARAGMPWRSASHSVAVLGSHDTSRWRDVAGSREVALVGFAALMTLPFVPGVYYGDEFGVRGGSADTARGTMPWNDPAGRDEVLHDAVRRLVHLRRSRAALRRGGFRWAHVAADALVFLRETDDERILVHLSRAPHPPIRLATSRLGTRELHPLLAETPRLTGDTAITLPSDGPVAHVWHVAG